MEQLLELYRRRIANPQAIFDMAGDATWIELFPDYFQHNHTVPPFNVRDLDTGDNMVAARLPAMMEENADAPLLLGHMMGVDHVGHRYGPAHSVMSRKLQDVNLVVEKVVERLRADDLLVAIGDHGMTARGDHGGDSESERRSAVLFYSKQQHLWERLQGTPASIYQTDVVPTISLLLGTPIPYNSLGAVVPALFTVGRDGPRQALHAVQVNAHQVRRYLLSYSNVTGTPWPSPAQAAELDTMLRQADDLAARAATVAARDQAVEAYLAFLTAARRASEAAWTTFDLVGMVAGIVVLVAVTLGQLGRLLSADQQTGGGRSSDSRLAVLASTMVGSYVEWCWRRIVMMVGFNNMLTAIFSLSSSSLTSTQLGTMAAYLLLSGWPTATNRLSTVMGLAAGAMAGGQVPAIYSGWLAAQRLAWRRLLTLENIVTTVVVLLRVLLPFSNSLVVYEDRLLRFSFVLLVVVYAAPGFLRHFRPQQPQHSSKSRWHAFYFGAAAALLGRLALLFGECREEQMGCVDWTTGAWRGSNTALWVAIVSFLATQLLARAWFSYHEALRGIAWLRLQLLLPLFAVACIMEWVIEHHQGEAVSEAKLEVNGVEDVHVWSSIWQWSTRSTFARVVWARVAMATTGAIFTLWAVVPDWHGPGQRARYSQQAQSSDPQRAFFSAGIMLVVVNLWGFLQLLSPVYVVGALSLWGCGLMVLLQLNAVVRPPEKESKKGKPHIEGF